MRKHFSGRDGNGQWPFSAAPDLLPDLPDRRQNQRGQADGTLPRIRNEGQAALNRQDQIGAIIAENNLAPFFVRLCDSSAATTTKLHILRVGTDGSSSDMVVQQWSRTESTVYTGTPNGDGSNSITATTTQSGPRVVFDAINSITNADTGALFSWQAIQQGYCALLVDSSNPLQPNPQCQATVNGVTDNHLTTTAGTAIASDVIWQPPVPTFLGPVSPVLQLADGSYVGQALSYFGTQSMVAFDASGNVNWTAPGYNADTATDDGGVIAGTGTVCTPSGCATGPSVTFDANGNSTGQQVSSETISWTGNSYSGQSTVDQISSLPVDYADTFATQAGNNPSQNGTYVKGRAYAQFKKCISINPNALCPHDSVLVALQDLQTKLGANGDQCPDCTKYIFSPLGATSEEAQFSKFIRRIPQFYDGTRSTVKLGQLCEQNLNSSTPNDAGYACFGDLGYGGSGPSVADAFQEHPNLRALAKYQPTNAHDPKGKKGLVVFFRPSAICITSALSNSTC